MPAPSTSDNLHLSVTNLGPIARADIDLRPMTVFVGPSNTGKSYLAILIYALHRFFSGRTLEAIDDRINDGDNPVSLETIDSALPESAAKLVRHRLEDVGDYGQVLDAEIARCFAVEDTASLLRNLTAKSAQVVVKGPVTDASGTSASFDYAFSISRNRLELAARIPGDAPLRLLETGAWRARVTDDVNWLAQDFQGDDEEAHRAALVLGNLAGSIGRDVVSPLAQTAHYLPADRAGVIRMYDILSDSLINEAAHLVSEDDLPLIPSPGPAIEAPGVMADLFERLTEMSEEWHGAAKARQESIAAEIEKTILKGEIRTFVPFLSLPEFLYRPDGWRKGLELTNASSTVTELAPVVLYLRHVVRPGETLIIEEPESHLHPEMQVEFTRQLAAVALSSVRVIITTHSELVLEELANLVRLSELPKSRRKGIGGAPYALEREQLGIWRFEPKKRPRGTVVREIPFNPDIGNFDSGFDVAAMGTYNDQAEIIRREERLKANGGRR